MNGIVPHIVPDDNHEIIIIDATDSDPPLSSRRVDFTWGQSDENRLLVPLLLAGSQLVSALLDTGASHSILDKKVAALLDLPINPVENLVLHGFGVDNACKIVGQVSVPVSIHGQELSKQDFWVLESLDDYQHVAVLGADFVVANHISVNISRRRISRFFPDGSVWEYYVPNPDETCRVNMRNIPCYVEATTSIEPGKTREVSVRWTLPGRSIMACCSSCCTGDLESTNLFLVDEPESTGAPQVICGLTNGLEECSLVLVANHGLTRASVKEGQLLCSLSSVIDASWLDSSREVAVMADSEHSDPDGMDQPIVLGSHLSEAQKSAINNLIDREQSLFRSPDTGFGFVGVTKHRIELYDETPIYQRPRRFPEVVGREIERQCEELRLLDIIEPSSSPWSSPVVPVRKKDGTIRMCVDYRKLNTVTKSDKFPIPNLNDAVFGLHGMRYFTSMDLVRGYYHLPLEEDSREYTAFSTPRAHWQFKRLSFGLKNAPSAFQREMQSILSDFPWRKVIVYIDDVLILGESFEEHLLLVEKVMETLAAHGCKVNLKKCQWFCEEVEFLGHLVSSAGLSKPPGYIETLDKFQRPTTVRELREFLGFVNFQRKFVPHCSTIMKPLSILTGGRRSTKLVWTDEMVSAFEKLKEEMRKNVTLAFPDYSDGSSPLELFTDASGRGVGACLMQQQSGALRPIAYASMAFTRAECNYNTLEKELAAIRWGVRTFRAFLFGIDFVVHTDHQPLVYLHNMQIVNSRLARTLQDLSDFNFIIQYTPGRTNTGADALSRLPDHLLACPVDPEIPLSGIIPEGLCLMKLVPGGGDSLPESLLSVAKQAHLNAVPPTSLELRRALVKELLKSPEMYYLRPKDLKQHLRLMEHAGQLLCVEALLAFCHLYECVTLVHYGGVVPVVYSSPSSEVLVGKSRVHLQCLAGVHYNPLVETKTYDVPDAVSRATVSLPLLDSSVEKTLDVDRSDVESVVDAEVDVDLLCNHCRPSSWCAYHAPTHVSSIMAEFGDKQYCVLLDTGAQISCVAELVCHEHSLIVEPAPCTVIRGFGSVNSLILGLVTITLSLAPDCVVTHSFFVVGNNTMPYCFILGADCFLANCLELDLSGHQLRNEDMTVRLCFADRQLSFDPTVAPLSIFQVSLTRVINTRRVYVGALESGLTFGVTHDDCVSNLTGLINPDEILTLQRQDRQISTIRRHLQQDRIRDWPRSAKQFRRYSTNLTVINGVVAFSRPGQPPLVVVTFTFLVEVMLVVHHKMAHPGRQKLLSMITEHIWHPSVARVARDVTRTCDACQRMKVSPTIQPPVTKIVTSLPFELVAVDLVAFPTTRRGKVCCLVLVDHHSKWLSAVPLTGKKSSCVVGALKQQILPYLLRLPMKLLSDNGPEFSAAEFSNMLQEYGIQHIFTTPYKPSSNGLVERANRTLTELLRNLATAPSTWDEDLPKAIMVYNTTYHSELGMSPSQFLLAKEHVMRDVPVVPSQEPAFWKEGNPSFVPFRMGQAVLRKVVFKGRQLVDKFSARFEGPFIVCRVNDNKVTYVVECPETHRQFRVHHRQLRVYHRVPAYLRDHPYYSQLEAEGDPPESCASYRSEGSDDVPLAGAYFASSESDFSGGRNCVSHVDDDYSVYSDDMSGTCDIEELGSSPDRQVSEKPNAVALVLERLGQDEYDMLQLLKDHSAETSARVKGLDIYPLSSADKPDNPSGYVVGMDELWSVSDIVVDPNLSMEDVPFGYCPEYSPDQLVATALDCLHESCEVVDQVLSIHLSSSTHLSSFEGFGEPASCLHHEDGEANNVNFSELRLSLGPEGHSDNTRGSSEWDLRFRDAELRLERLRVVISQQRRLSHNAAIAGRRPWMPFNVRSPIRTRSTGEVQDHPNVQPRVLEYDMLERVDGCGAAHSERDALP